MATPTPGSANISILDSKITADLCAGNFYVDVTPSTWVGTGYNNVQGASVRITNPVGVIIKNYPTSGFDIYPPMTGNSATAIPLIAGIYAYGTYTIDVKLTDSNGNNWTVTKTVNLCPPDPNNKNRNYGCLNMSIQGNCKTGKVIFLLNNPANYKGTVFTSQVNALVVKYPTASGLANLSTTLGSFSLLLFEGQYQVAGTSCVLYNYGDSVYFKVNYKIKCEKIIKCMIDECCVFEKLAELNLQLKSDCTQDQKDTTSSLILDAIRLLKTAELAADCGQDPSDYITDLEELLGCVCTCNCNEGTPIIGTNGLAGFVYRALLSQTGTSAPTAVLSSLNTVTISWAYSTTGYYIGTISGLRADLTADTTYILTGAASAVLSSSSAKLFIGAGYLSANSIYVYTNDNGTPENALLNGTEFELTILG
jgi:hypothetical protein